MPKGTSPEASQLLKQGILPPSEDQPQGDSRNIQRKQSKDNVFVHGFRPPENIPDKKHHLHYDYMHIYVEGKSYRKTAMEYSVSTALFTDDFHQNTLAPTAIKLTIKDLLPGAKIEPSRRHRNHDFASHEGPLQVTVAIILTGFVVFVK